MPPKRDRLFEIKGQWLSQRPGRPNWHRTWFNPTTRQTGRLSLGTEDLEAAKLLLAEYVTTQAKRPQQEPDTVMLYEVFRRYMVQHGKDLASAGVQRRNLYVAAEHLGAVTVEDFDLDRQRDLVRQLEEAEYRAGTIKRMMGTARAAIQWAYDRGELTRMPPFLKKLPDSPPRERIMSIEELAALYGASDQDYLRNFILLMICTLARPGAVLELTRFQCDINRRLIDLNPPSRIQTKKRRPAVPMADALVPLIENCSGGHLVEYRGRPISKVTRGFQNARERAGLDKDIVPYTIRHTMATELRSRGVPELELAGILGHKMPNYRTTEIYAKYSPNYLGSARQAIDEVVKAMGGVLEHSAHLTYDPVRASCVPVPKSRITKIR